MKRANPVFVLLLAAIFCVGPIWAALDSGPQPPCGTESSPPYSDVDKPPITSFWDRSDQFRDWVPPPCTGWTTHGFASLVAAAGRFRSPSGADDIRRRIGAISEYKGLLYWSTTHKQWQTLIVDAFATSGPPSNPRRKDFSPAEISEGSVFYYQQTDNLAGKAIYRMHIITASPDRLVFETENITTMRYLLVPLFHPGDLQSIYFIERESNDIWRYYSIVRTGRDASKLTTGHEASSINRAGAFDRYLAAIPTNMEPPAAR
jgi:hypothetical protein